MQSWERQDGYLFKRFFLIRRGMKALWLIILHIPAKTPLIYWHLKHLIFTNFFSYGKELNIKYARLYPWLWQHGCVPACFLPGTTLISTGCLPSVIRTWTHTSLNRPVFTPVNSTCSVPSMRSMLTSASTAKRWVEPKSSHCHRHFLRRFSRFAWLASAFSSLAW